MTSSKLGRLILVMLVAMSGCKTPSVEVYEVERYRDGGTVFYKDFNGTAYYQYGRNGKVYLAYPFPNRGSVRPKPIRVKLIISAIKPN
jgi:hypothetical protein